MKKRYKSSEIKITQKDVDELKRRLKNHIDSEISGFLYRVWHRERCEKYKLELEVGDKVKITEKDLITMGYPKGTRIEGKITEIIKAESSYPPYVARIDITKSKNTIFKSMLFGIGWLKKVKR